MNIFPKENEVIASFISSKTIALPSIQSIQLTTFTHPAVNIKVIKLTPKVDTQYEPQLFI